MKRSNKYTFLLLILLLIGYYYYPYKVEAMGYYDKVWAHRVNSKEKLNLALQYFEGVELDLVYNTNSNLLDVNHPPTTSIGLSFENYLKEIEERKFPYLWLDIKNLNENNAVNILEKIVLLFNAKNYPLDKVLIESKSTNQLLIFEEEGFKTSYYLPSELHKKDSLGLSKSIVKIKNVIKKQPNIAISTDYRDYEIIKKEFPKHQKYIWAIKRFPIHLSHFKIRRILKDSTVKIVLLKYNVLIGDY